MSQRMNSRLSRIRLMQSALAILVVVNAGAGAIAQATKQVETVQRERVGPTPDGRIVVPTNQGLKPAGKQVSFPGRPNDVALSPVCRLLAVLSRKEVLTIDIESGRVLG